GATSAISAISAMVVSSYPFSAKSQTADRTISSRRRIFFFSLSPTVFISSLEASSLILLQLYTRLQYCIQVQYCSMMRNRWVRTERPTVLSRTNTVHEEVHQWRDGSMTWRGALPGVEGRLC